jgi:hypothetical protein
MKLSILLHPVRDNLGLRKPGVYRIPVSAAGTVRPFHGHQAKGASTTHPAGTSGQVSHS